MKTKVEIEVSARHIHLSKSDYEILFGPEYEFQNIRELSQCGEFATDKLLDILGPKGRVKARFISPFRDLTQAELSLTDCFALGISAPYEIKVVDGGEKITITGKSGEVERDAAMVTKRHLHCNPGEANELGLSSDQQVSVEIETDRGRTIYHNITVKIADNFNLRIHLDTDEGNAAGIQDKCFGNLIIGENDISN